MSACASGKQDCLEGKRRTELVPNACVTMCLACGICLCTIWSLLYHNMLASCSTFRRAFLFLRFVCSAWFLFPLVMLLFVCRFFRCLRPRKEQKVRRKQRRRRNLRQMQTVQVRILSACRLWFCVGCLKVCFSLPKVRFLAIHTNRYTHFVQWPGGNTSLHGSLVPLSVRRSLLTIMIYS